MAFYNRYGYNNNNDYNNYYNDTNYNYERNSNCYMRKKEETFCCPSYYNEDSCRNEKRFYPCYEGTFKICPSYEKKKK